MSQNKVRKTVSFNVTNPQDKTILEQIENVNFSGYVKELIQADLKKRNQELRIVQKTDNGGVKIVVSR